MNLSIAPLLYINTSKDYSLKDYYPFGMVMPARSYNAGTYRYGFSGVEQDNEIKGVGNTLDMKFRVYDSRIGRFLSTDPLEKIYAWNSTYAYAMNRVIDGIDIEGKEYLRADESRLEVYQGRARLKLENFTTAIFGGQPYVKQFTKQFPNKYFDYYDSKGGLKPNPMDVFSFGTQQQLQEYKNGFRPSSLTAQTVGPHPKDDEPTVPIPGGTRTAAGIIGAVNVTNFGLESYLGSIFTNDIRKLDESKVAFESAFDDLQAAIKTPGMIPLQYHNTTDFSQILNVILQGQTTVGNQELYQIGLRITDEISHNFSPSIKEVISPQRGLDGVRVGQPQIIYNTREEMIDPSLIPEK